MLLYRGHELGNVPASNTLSERISKDLKKRGLKYLGPVVYAHLQACGVINDHLKEGHRYKHLIDQYAVEYVGSDYPTIEQGGDYGAEKS